jgi:hypothetical protein
VAGVAGGRKHQWMMKGEQGGFVYLDCMHSLFILSALCFVRVFQTPLPPPNETKNR